MRKCSVYLLGLLLIWVGLCFAGEDADHICFRRIDANQDGNVTFKEFAAHYGKDEKKFKAADVDSDGRLTHDEYHDALGHGAMDESDGK